MSFYEDYDLSEEQVLARRQPLFPKITGLYFLIKGTTIVYVGQSTDIYARIAQHSQDVLKEFDSFSVLECPTEHLASPEAHYIYKFRPPLNSSLPRNQRYKSFLQIQKKLRVPARVLKLWMKHKDIGYSRDGYYLLSDFNDFADFVDWMARQYPHISVEQCSIHYLKEYLGEIKKDKAG